MNQAKCKQTAEIKSNYLSIGLCIHKTISPWTSWNLPIFMTIILAHWHMKGGEGAKGKNFHNFGPIIILLHFLGDFYWQLAWLTRVRTALIIPNAGISIFLFRNYTVRHENLYTFVSKNSNRFVKISAPHRVDQ